MTTTQVPVSEDIKEKITAVIKTKNPKRVEAGKRLAEISKAAKERKMRERIEQEAGETSDSLFTFQNILAVVGISIGAVALFYELYPRMYPRKVEPKVAQPQHDGTNVEI